MPSLQHKSCVANEMLQQFNNSRIAIPHADKTRIQIQKISQKLCAAHTKSEQLCGDINEYLFRKICLKLQHGHDKLASSSTTT